MLDFLRILRRRKRGLFPIYVWAPPYSQLSGGVRALHLLCHHLTRLGYDAYITEPDNSASPIPLRYLDALTKERHVQQHREPIYVYPEIIGDNPGRAKFVVRYLLNKPGSFGDAWSPDEGDYFLTYAPEHIAKRAFDLFIPLVDRSAYFPPAPDQPRDGFVIFRNRLPPPDPASLPGWLSPHTLVSMHQPRSHIELGQLYRQARAMVTCERTSAIFEALACGCPVIAVENKNFNPATYQPRFRDCGVVWGFDEDKLPEAMTQIRRFNRRYSQLERSLDRRITKAFDFIIGDVQRRQRQDEVAASG